MDLVLDAACIDLLKFVYGGKMLDFAQKTPLYQARPNPILNGSSNRLSPRVGVRCDEDAEKMSQRAPTTHMRLVLQLSYRIRITGEW